MLFNLTAAKSLLWGCSMDYSTYSQTINCAHDALFKIANITETDTLVHTYFCIFANVF